MARKKATKRPTRPAVKRSSASRSSPKAELLAFLSRGGGGEARTGWLPLCTLDLPTGALWAGDPYCANREDGCIAEVSPGRYVVEGIGRLEPRLRMRVVARLRVRAVAELTPRLAEQLGESGTDSALIAVCDIGALDAACGAAPADGTFERDIGEGLGERGFGLHASDRFPGAVMAVLPTGSDGTGPVFALRVGARCVGFELPFGGEPELAED